MNQIDIDYALGLRVQSTAISLASTTVSSIHTGSTTNSIEINDEQEKIIDYLEMNTNLENTSSISINRSDATIFENQILLERFTRNRSIDGPWYYILIGMYSFLIIFGATGNFMVVLAIVRKPLMRTARNLFILNLAISDMILCVVTMPLTLMEILSKYWPFGSCAFFCKMIGTLQGLSIFVSTISIIAIASDRYQLIVFPTKRSLQIGGAILIVMCIWSLAFLLASPMFIFKELVYQDMPPVLQEIGIDRVIFCIEDWPINNGRFYYSIFSLCVQYLLPIMIVSGAYFGIYNKLKSRITVVTVQSTSEERQIQRGRRMKRTNFLLISIAVIFGISWLPLNIFNLYADMKRSVVTQHMLVIYAICHMMGMSSACSNPLLYGWLNDNFRKEFQELLCLYKQNTNVALNGHTTGGVQTRRRRKHHDIEKGDLKLLGNGGGNGDENDGKCGGSGYNGLRSAVTESVALTENPMSTEVTTLVTR